MFVAFRNSHFEVLVDGYRHFVYHVLLEQKSIRLL